MKRTTADGGASSAVAAEARDIVRRAAGDVVGKTVAAQVRQAARHLGYAADDWRVREAWYGRAGSWSATALDELRRRHATWRETAAGAGQIRGGATTAMDRNAIAQRLGAIRAALAEVQRQVAQLEAEVAAALDEGPAP